MAHEGSQVFVRGLDGKTLCIQLSSKEATGLILKSCIQERTGIPSKIQRLVSCGREISNECVLESSGVNHDLPSCTLLLPLVGGKGGFGSLLRGAGTKAGQKKTTNYDACRDMSGRRLRHVNAEKKLKEWIHDAKERELEKAGEEFIRRLAKEKKQTDEDKVNLNEFREQTAEAIERLSEAVEFGLKESKRQIQLGKRPASTINDTDLSKRSKLFGMLEDFEEDDDESDYEDEDDDVDTKGEVSVPSEKLEVEEEARLQTPDVNGESKARSSFASSSSEGPESSSSSEKESSEKECISDEKLEKQNNQNSNLENESGSKKTVNEMNSVSELKQPVNEILPVFETRSATKPVIEPVIEPDVEILPVNEPAIEIETETETETLMKTAIEIKPVTENEEDSPLVLDGFANVDELKGVGMDKLKKELMRYGLKCGGNCTERAERLFLLKHTPLNKIEKHHFAKLANSKKK